MKVKNPLKNKKILSLLKEYYEQYAYLNCAYGDEPKSFSFYVNKYKKLFSLNLKKYNPFIMLKERLKEKEKILQKINDEKISKLVNLMEKVGVFRDKNKAKLGKTIRYRLMILNEIARRKLERRENLNYYLLSEILNLLAEKKRLSRKEISLRKKNGITLIRFEYLTYGLPRFFKKIEKNRIKILKGTCASPGKIQGRAKIILSQEDIKKIKKGDIMVAIGTDFNLLEAIFRAEGIITEEGGFLSHAAILSRELKKPCCIGVKGATRIISDGMKIILNATEGKIKICAP